MLFEWAFRRLVSIGSLEIFDGPTLQTLSSRNAGFKRNTGSFNMCSPIQIIPRSKSPPQKIASFIWKPESWLTERGNCGVSTSNPNYIFCFTIPELTARPWKWLVGMRLFPFQMAHFPGSYVSFREGNRRWKYKKYPNQRHSFRHQQFNRQPKMECFQYLW